MVLPLLSFLQPPLVTIQMVAAHLLILTCFFLCLVEVDTEEGRQHLTAKTMHAFKYVYDNHKDDADWFMKVLSDFL